MDFEDHEDWECNTCSYQCCLNVADEYEYFELPSHTDTLMSSVAEECTCSYRQQEPSILIICTEILQAVEDMPDIIHCSQQLRNIAIPLTNYNTIYSKHSG